MSLTVAEVRSSLARYAGSGNVFLDRLNEVCARLIQSGSFKGTKEQIGLTVYADADGNSIVSLPRGFDTILAGAVSNSDVPCSGMPMGVVNGWTEFSKNGLGYGGLSGDFQEVNGRFAVFREWTGAAKIRLKFEANEPAGVIHLRGNLDGTPVFSAFGGEWVQGEKLNFSAMATVTSTKKFEAPGFSAVKPVTRGRVSVYCVDDDGTETAVGLWEPGETVPRLRRYKVPTCEGVEPVAATLDPNQFYTKDEIMALFKASDVVSVSDGGTTNLDYGMFFLRVVKIIAIGGAGPYEHSFVLGTAGVTDGATFRIKLEIAQSSDPVLLFYSGSLAGTLLQEVDGDSSNALYTTLVFAFNGSDWSYEGREII